MHVLIIPSWYPRHSGDVHGSFFREQTLALQRNECKVGVIYPELHSLKEWKFFFSGKKGFAFENDEGIKTYRFRGFNWFPRIAKFESKLFLRKGLQLYREYTKKNGPPDIIHAHSLLYGGLIASEIRKIHEIPFVVTEHSSGFARNLISKENLITARNSSLESSEKFAVSPELAELLDQKIGFPASKKWKYLPNIVSSNFTNNELKETTDKNYHHFLNIAFMNKNKRQENIIYAFSELHKINKNIYLTIGGDGPERKKLEKLVIDLKIKEKVKFTGILSRSQVISTLRNSDTFILASNYETFGVVAIEALALGIPVIATKCGGPNSIIQRGDGILVPINDIVALTTAMLDIIKNKIHYNSADIKNNCIKRYGEEAVINQLKNTYGKIINSEKTIRKSITLNS